MLPIFNLQFAVKMNIRVFITDDHPLIKDGLQSVLQGHEHITLTGAFERGSQLLAALREQQPDVLLLDLQLPDKPGDELLKTVKQTYPKVKIIILTSNENPYAIKMLLKSGADGYLLKNSIAGSILKAIEHVVQYEGEPYLHEDVRNIIQKTFPRDTKPANTLTPRELEILELIAQEMTSQEIGEKLHIHFRSVEIYRVGIMRKLGAKNMVGMVKKAMLMGLLRV